MNTPAHHLAGDQAGQRNYPPREDQPQGQGREPAPRAQGGDDEEE